MQKSSGEETILWPGIKKKKKDQEIFQNEILIKKVKILI